MDEQRFFTGSPRAISIDQSQAYGILVHKLLELSISGDKWTSDQYTNLLRSHSRHPMQEDSMSAIIKLARSEVDQLLGSHAWLNLIKDAQKTFCEAPMAAVDGHNLISAVADLLILTKSGDYRIVDFKTTQSDQQHAKAICEYRGYFDQVNHYRKILERCKPGVKISGHIVFVNPVYVIDCD